MTKPKKAGQTEQSSIKQRKTAQKGDKEAGHVQVKESKDPAYAKQHAKQLKKKQKVEADDEEDEGDEGEEGDEDEEGDVVEDLLNAQVKRPPPGPPSKRSWMCTLLWVIALAGLAYGLFVLKFDGSQDFEGMDVKPPSEDYYALLGLDRTEKITTNDIKRSYRQLSLQFHPDKHPDCLDCQEKFASISNAYQVLSNPEQRAAYDQLDASYETLKSDYSVSLTNENYDALVTNSDQFWIILVYSDWHRSCIAFHPAWEQVAHQFSNHVKFGRVHIQQKELVKKLPVAFGVVPSVFAVHRGRAGASKVFYGRHKEFVALLSTYIDQEYEYVGSLLKSEEEIEPFLTRPIGVEKERVRMVLVTHSPRMALAVKNQADNLSGMARFAVLSLDRSKGPAVLDLIQSRFGSGETRVKSFPVLLSSRYRDGRWEVDVVKVDINTLGQTGFQALQKTIPNVSSGGFVRWCQDPASSVKCVIYLLCGSKQAQPDLHTQLQGLRSRLADENLLVAVFDTTQHSEGAVMCHGNNQLLHIVSPTEARVLPDPAAVDGDNFEADYPVRSIPQLVLTPLRSTWLF